MSLLMRPLTYDDLRQMPDDHNRYEIIGGELLVSPSPNRAHQTVSYLLTQVVGDHVDVNRLGKVFAAPVDVQLSPHNTVQPDILFIRQDRLDIYPADGPVEGPPNLVVEIISPSSRIVDRTRKAALYADSGVLEYWVVDPEERQFQLFVLADGRYETIDTVDGRFHSTAIPGLIVDPAALFVGLE